jgi:hypothetical protein
MPLEVRDIRPDPTLDLVAADAETGASRRVMTYAGQATVAPVVQPGGFQIRVSTQVVGQPPQGETAGFYPPIGAPLPKGDAAPQMWAEVALTYAVLGLAAGSQDVALGVDAVEVVLVDDPKDPSRVWPYVRFECFTERQLGIRYRLTVSAPA